MANHKPFRDFHFDKFLELVDNDHIIEVFNEINLLRWQYFSNYSIQFMLENNARSIDYRKKLIVYMFGDNVSPYTLAILFYLLEDKLFYKLDYFLNKLKAYYTEHSNLIIIDLTYRHSPSNDVLVHMKNLLEKKYHKKVAFIPRQDNDVLGGMKFSWMGGEIDLTVRRKVTLLKTLLVKGGR